MGFRSDREALKARRDVLERQRDDALEEIERVRSISGEDERERLRERVQDLSQELDAVRRGMNAAAVGVRVAVIALVGLLVVALISAGIFFVSAGAGHADAATEIGPELSVEETPTQLPSPPEAEVAATEAVASPIEAHVPRLTLDSVFEARVRSSSLPGVRRRQVCWIALHEHVVGDGGDTEHRTVSAVCGDQRLYWSESALSGVSSKSWNIALPLTHAVYSDTGPRTGRPQFMMDSRDGVARVWDDTTDWSVRFQIEQIPNHHDIGPRCTDSHN